MYLTSRNGRRTISVAPSTCERVIDYISTNVGKTSVEYAEALLVAEPTVNLIIELFLLELVRDGQIAVSNRGRKPDWYYCVAKRSVVPVRKVSRPVGRITLPGITDKQLRQDYVGLVIQYATAGTRSMSPARRAKSRKEFVARVAHVGSNHQDTINDGVAQIARLEQEMKGLREAVQVIATAMTGGNLLKAAA